MSICLIDTSIFVEIMDVPNMNGDRNTILTTLDEYIQIGYSLLLPIATIIETGNHIAQNGNGNQRLACAQRFVHQVKAAFSGEAPWSPSNTACIDDLVTWIDDFPFFAQRTKAMGKTEGTSLGDMLIIEEWERICRQNPYREVLIWSKDVDLLSYHQPAARW